MKTIRLISVFAFCSFLFNVNAQPYVKIDTSFYSSVLGEEKMVDVYLPQDYYQNLNQQYAVIYYLHSATGDQNTGSICAYYYYQQHYLDTATITSPPAIYVCPDGSCSPYLGSEYVNSVLYGNYEDFIIQDVIAFTEASFRVKPGKDFRFITGTSMGGFGTGWLTANYPELFRAAFPYIGFMAWPDTTQNIWKELCYQENGSYSLDYNAGINTQLFFTGCGGYSPNLNLPPYYIEIPFDTNGNWVDTIQDKWYEFEVSRLVGNLPGSDELAWFLGCGKLDYLGTYPTYQVLMDSMDANGLDYDTCFFNGGHVLHPPTWKAGMHWMDSIINQSFNVHVTIESPPPPEIQLSLFPNPAYESCQLTFTLDQTASVKVEILNTMGTIVWKNDPGNQSSGKHTQNLDIRHPASDAERFCTSTVTIKSPFM